MIKREILDLIEISRFYGSNNEYVIAGGGNTSYKDPEWLWIKASGTSLDGIDKDGFVIMDRARLGEMTGRKYSSNPELREKEVKKDLYASRLDPASELRPSVETNLHDIIDYSFVVHLHPTLVNALLCGRQSREITVELFPDALYIPYTDPGYILFCRVYDEIRKYRKKSGYDPKVIFLENHGVFVSANSANDIRELYSDILSAIKARLISVPDIMETAPAGDLTKVLPAIRMLFSTSGLKTAIFRNNSLIARFSVDKQSFSRISAPFTPDMIVYCKSRYLHIDQGSSPDAVIDAVKEELPLFVKEYGYLPHILLIRDWGLVAIGDNWKSAATSLDVFEDLMKISHYSESFGGPRFMTPGQIEFIDNWEVENYRRQIGKGEAGTGIINGRIAIVTGGALGFGAGIASSLYDSGANVVIADINREGENLAASLNSRGGKNRACFVYANIAEPQSVNDMVKKTVEMFGGLDLVVSNAGILYAGSIEEMSEEVFETVTRINYNGYFHCVKYSAPVMKLQFEHNNGHFSDIIQINSKSGLKGSNKNFAYAGGKFGGIGLTQSFALELIPFNIKVNSICPGNFFEGPLWSDPETGLFVQYLRTGKVPGAKTVEDVKRHYENQVPARRGCRVDDVMKALYYIIGQQYETGQAVPVTGGQSMLH
jgi:NAD(P)-dependent dehydrogenase (short-subunit alcohol dehydrogenase family)/rhamnose utilization protein RhaD (predicted bifunctional aldolase and dehydrogenase)